MGLYAYILNLKEAFLRAMGHFSLINNKLIPLEIKTEVRKISSKISLKLSINEFILS